jgi:hypothetical protein
MKFPFARKNFLLFQVPLAALLVGTSAPPGGPPLGGLFSARLNLAFTPTTTPPPGRINEIVGRIIQGHMSVLDEGPASSAYLAVRNARQAIHDNPEDAASYLLLAQAYQCLRDQTRERICVARPGGNPNPVLPPVDSIRQSQIAGALHRVLALSPKPEMQQVAHFLLAYSTFTGPEYLEVRFGHLRTYLELSRALHQVIGFPPKQYGEGLVAQETDLKRGESQLKKQHDQFVVTGGSKRLLEKVNIAMRNGLAETALELLLKADPKDMTDPRAPGQRPGATVLVDLLLRLGRLDDARMALYPESGPDESTIDKRAFGMHPQVGLPAYYWLRVQMAAASGDYDLADELLAAIHTEDSKGEGLSGLLGELDILPQDYPATKKIDRMAFAGLIVGDFLLARATQATHMPWQLLSHVPYRLHKPHLLKPPGGQFAFVQGARLLSALLEREAEVWALRAWLALEHGRTDRAREYAGKVLSLADLGLAAPGIRRVARFRSLPLAQICMLRLAQQKD